LLGSGDCRSGKSIGVNELSDHFYRHCADVRIGVARKQSHCLGKHFTFLGLAGPFLTPVAC